MKAQTKSDFSAEVIRPVRHKAKIRGRWDVRCVRPDGSVAWEDRIENMVVNEGLNYVLSAALAAGTPITAWYIGITNASPTPAAADTMASHAGWTEWTNYSESTRQTWTPGTVANQQVSNSGSKARVTCNAASQTVGGAFLVSSDAKGGTTGTLYAVGAFSGGNKALNTGEILEITATFSLADDGV